MKIKIDVIAENVNDKLKELKSCREWEWEKVEVNEKREKRRSWSK